MQGRLLLGFLGIVASEALSQPFVQPGLAVTRVAPRLDGQVPRLEAIDSPLYGTGVVTASANGSVVTFRLLRPTGQLEPLAVLTDVWSPLEVVRTRLDPTGAFGGQLHATITDATLGGTVLVSISTTGVIVQRYRSSSLMQFEAYDFEFDGSSATPQIVFLDRNSSNGTRLATLSSDYDYNLRNNNSFPLGRSDTDVVGLRFDVTGLYGGSLILADSDCNELVPRSAIWSLSNVATGGVYSAIANPVPCSQRVYGDLDIAMSGRFGQIVYVTDTLSNQVQRVLPDGTHITWATGFTGIGSLSISPDGESMYISDENGIWLIGAEGNLPGPTVLAQNPNTPPGSPMSGAPVTAAQIVFSEPVVFSSSDLTVVDRLGSPVGFDLSGSGSQFMVLGFAQALLNDVYTITIMDTTASLVNGRSLDGDNDGLAGGNAVLVLEHIGPVAPPFCSGDADASGVVDFADIVSVLQRWLAVCP